MENKELIRLKCLYRINLMEQRDAEGNKHLIAKLKRKLYRLNAA